MSVTGLKRRESFKTQVSSKTTPSKLQSSKLQSPKQSSLLNPKSTCLLEALPSTRLKREFNPGLYDPEFLPILTTTNGSHPQLVFPKPFEPTKPESNQFSTDTEYMKSPQLISVYINSLLTPDEEEFVLSQPLSNQVSRYSTS